MTHEETEQELVNAREHCDKLHDIIRDIYPMLLRPNITANERDTLLARIRAVLTL